MISMAWTRDVDPQNAKDTYWQKLKTFISILVTQDHIESIGKLILFKWDEVLLNGLHAQSAYYCSKTIGHFLFQICPKLKVKLSPTKMIYPAPPSSFDLATARNPNSSVTLIQISVSPRWPCKLSVACCNYFGLTEICNRSHRVCLTNSMVRPLVKSVSPSSSSRSQRDEVFP